MKLLEFIMDIAPRYCNVHQCNGITSGLVYNAELEGEKAYAAESFESVRDRAKAFVPYCNEEKNGNQKNVVDIIELAICSHRQSEHGEDHKERIEELEFALVSEEPAFLHDYSIEDAKSEPGWLG